MFRTDIIEDIAIVDKETQLTDTIYRRRHYLFGIKIRDYNYTRNGTIIDNKQKGIGFGNKDQEYTQRMD